MNEIEKAIAVYEDNITQMELNPDAYGDDLPRFKLVLTTLREQAKLTKAKADGRLVVLPCKVGDTIYFPDHYNKRVDSRLITGIRQNTSGTWQVIGGLLCFPFSSFGVSIFLTREAAEKALAEVVDK